MDNFEMLFEDLDMGVKSQIREHLVLHRVIL